MNTDKKTVRRFILILALLLFFALSVAYVHGCERL